MEKVSFSMQLLGKLMFAQCTQLLNAKLNDCLPPSLAVDNPSKSFTTKGLDITMAAYMSELAHLSHPVSAHIGSAEMNNQSVNSLALITARNTLEALDLQCLHLEFLQRRKTRDAGSCSELQYVRKTLGVPIHRGLQDYRPTLGTNETPGEPGKEDYWHLDQRNLRRFAQWVDARLGDVYRVVRAAADLIIVDLKRFVCSKRLKTDATTGILQHMATKVDGGSATNLVGASLKFKTRPFLLTARPPAGRPRQPALVQ
ncbi:phenylalanine ammonia-lyase [Colletotrichum salicis]|uniref:Phenylalanine ammonia-lyase n=1 Tax=Colletotrichum salicis TaxID=1209931 RepID=A0A135V1S1_9PEZI|nr:phenylalanine ammonia-lyase [Colletotrichum salicis]